MRGPGRLLTAMVTPFGPDGRLDLTTAAKLARHLLTDGSDGLVVCGTTGESPTLSHDEKVQVLKAVIEAVGGHHVVAGTGSNDTRATIALSQEAEALGAGALLLISPYYNKPDQEGLFQHFQAVARQTHLPIILYNHPPRTGVSISARTLARLVETCPNIVGLKDSSGSLDVCSEFRAITPKDFLLYSGNDSLTLPIMAIGGVGAISVASHIAGPELKEMINMAAENKLDRARALHFKLWGLMNSLFVTPSPAPVKAALAHYGWQTGSVRLPLVDMPPVERAKLIEILERTLGTPEHRARQDDIGRRTIVEEPPADLEATPRPAEV